MKPSTPVKLTLLAIAWPIFVEQSLRILIGTVDTFMVSHVSDGAVAALGVSNRLIVVALICFNFIGVGTSVVITHHLGANDRKGAEGIATAAIGVNTWTGLIASVLVYLFAVPILRLMQLPESLMVYALPFLTMMGGTLFLESINIAIGATLRAHGRTRAVEGKCIFADRKSRGCKIHAYCLESGLDYHLYKPMVSILFPLTFEHGVLVPSPEAVDGSLICAGDGPSLYDGVRVELAHFFGKELVAALDGLRDRVTSLPPADVRRAGGARAKR